jgi:L-asparaginase
VSSEKCNSVSAEDTDRSTKARLLLMACLMRFGSLPAAKDADNPTQAERKAIEEANAAYQRVFDTQ